MSSNTEILRRASLEGLRAEAQEELGSVVTERLWGGEDPWAFMQELPTIDELVVLLLRADLFDAEGGREPGSDYARDRRMLGDIREAYPGLGDTIDGMLQRLDRLRWSS
ncbi:hypothetical protein BH10ACT6_BH10ACT6_10390 [soil metagenome]